MIKSTSTRGHSSSTASIRGSVRIAASLACLIVAIGLGIGCGDDTDCPAGFMRAGGECITIQLDGGAEFCNGQDDDFDGLIDEGNPGGGAACGTSEGECSEGVMTCIDGDLTCEGETSSTDEICDGLDNDCDGETDEDLLTTLYQDLDEDGVGSDVECTACGECEGMGPWVTATGDCNDDCATCSPLQVEICDGLDNDCDGMEDEDVQSIFYSDTDHDGFGTDMTCMACAPVSCEGEAADWATTMGDCADMDENIYPNATEICDGADNDCDGETDEGLLTTFYRDEDGDGYGTDETCEACSAADCRGGAELWAMVNGDCDDTALTGVNANPGLDEVCDHIDNDCVGGVDNGVSVMVFPDLDGDDYGTGPGIAGCATDPDTATVGGDCADGDERAHPGVTTYETTPIIGAVVDGRRFDFNCDGREDAEHLPCISCRNNGCWHNISVDGEPLANPVCGERGALRRANVLLGHCGVDAGGAFEIQPAGCL